MTNSASDPGARSVRLRDVEQGDLAIFFEHQRDPVAHRMAVFPPRDREAFMAHWQENVLGDETAVVRTILCDGKVAGSLVCFERSGRREVGYWLGRPFWGAGVATKALSEFLGQIEDRPLIAYVAKTNVGSRRVLEKCGFVLSAAENRPDNRGENAAGDYLFTLAK